MNRYFVDERGGCAAIMDRNLADPKYNGLHDDTRGVVKYIQGYLVDTKCKECGINSGRN